MTTKMNWFCVALAVMCACKTTSPSKSAAVESSGFAQHHQSGSKHSRAGYADSVNSGLIAIDTMKSSPRRVVMADVGSCHVHIDYGSPGVKGRNIWGGLVAFEQVWSAGAHSATAITFSSSVVINGKTITAGTYGFFAIPGKTNWTLIINNNYKQHLADDYSVTEDLVRVSAVPEPHSLTQRLTYTIQVTHGRQAAVILAWENICVRLPFEVAR
jgi:hypothetical protein